MKKILTFLAAVSVVFAACNKPTPKPLPPTPTEEGTTAETAFTVSEAIAKAKEVGSTASSTVYFIKGYVVGLSENGIAKYGNINVYLADSASETDKAKEFTGFQIKSFDGIDCIAGEVKAGDLVVICGPILYDATYGAETAGNGVAHIYSINGATERPKVEYKPIEITVSDITSGTASVSCEPGTASALYYFDVAEKGEWDSYTNKAEYLSDLIGLYKELYAMFEIEFDFEADMASVGADGYDFEDLDAEADYVVFAVYCDAEGKPLSEFYTKEFTTEAAEPVDDYPTLLDGDFAFTPATVTVSYWGACYEDTEEVSFDVYIEDAEGNGVQLEAMAAAGTTKIDGTYTVDMTYSYGAGTLIPGWIYEGSAYSSWLYQGESVVACITGGTLTITTSGDKATVDVALEDIKGNKITAKGSNLAYTYVDNSESYAAANAVNAGRQVKVKKATRAAQAKSTIKTHRAVRK